MGDSRGQGVSGVRGHFCSLCPGSTSLLLGSPGRVFTQPMWEEQRADKASMERAFHEQPPHLQAELGCREQALHWAVF